jgi:ATP-dependent RNA helicase DHX29
MDPTAIKGDWEYRINRPEYLRMLEHRRHLPMWTFRTEVLTTIEREQIVIICGETGW